MQSSSYKFLLAMLHTSWNVLDDKSSACDPEISSGRSKQHDFFKINSYMKD